MRKTGTLSTIALACAGLTILSAPAFAGTRPDSGRIHPTTGASPVLKTDVGPKNGFPDTPGLERARERANENAAFNRYKSGGAA
jgi:hypothetical protein